MKIKFKLIINTVIVIISLLVLTLVTKSSIVGFALVLINLVISLLTIISISKRFKDLKKQFYKISQSENPLDIELKLAKKCEFTDIEISYNDFIQKLKKSMTSITEIVHKNNSLSKHLHQSSKDSTFIGNDIKTEVEGLKTNSSDLLSSVQHASSSISNIIQAVDQLSNQVQTQFSAIEQSSAATEEIMGSITNVAKISESRLSTMDSLANLIQNGGHKVENTNNFIQEILSKAEDMMGMVVIINNIASQTNLLAMNASIEAAHAGDAGKGFSVVAHEIRNLAEETSSNATRIGDGLKETTDKIYLASEAGRESLESFKVIKNEVDTFSSSLREVSLSMNELSIASNEILTSVSTLVETSTSVKDATYNIEGGSKVIGDAITAVINATEKTDSIVKNVFKSTEDLESVSLVVSAFGNQNKYNNSLLKMEIDNFQTGDDIVVDDKKSAEIDWSDLLSVSVDEMDAEHKELFKRINKLLVAMLSKDKSFNLHDIANYLAEYIDFHFRDEEKMLEKYNYPDIVNHKKLHKKYEDDFKAIQARIDEGEPKSLILIDIQENVVSWLINHIAKVDTQYGKYLKELGVK